MVVKPWAVHVFVRGHYTGAYRYATEQEADADAADRRQCFTVLGCRYVVARSSVRLSPGREHHVAA
jgi:hypothetical protein